MIERPSDEGQNEPTDIVEPFVPQPPDPQAVNWLQKGWRPGGLEERERSE